MTEYEKDLNGLKEDILKDGDTLVSKRALLKRFCEMDKEYNGCPWNLLQILTNIHILIGEEPCEDAISRSSVFEIMGNLMSIPYDLDRPINKKDVSDSMGEIRVLPPVTPKQEPILDQIRADIEALPKTYPFVNHIDMYVKVSDVEKIIDKYKVGESK